MSRTFGRQRKAGGRDALEAVLSCIEACWRQVLGRNRVVCDDPGAGVSVMARTLDDLFDYLEGLQHRAALTDLVRHLEELEINCDDVSSFVRFSNRGYTRNLIRGGHW